MDRNEELAQAYALARANGHEHVAQAIAFAYARPFTVDHSADLRFAEEDLTEIARSLGAQVA